MINSNYSSIKGLEILKEKPRFRITGFIGKKEYSGRRGRKHYYNRPQDMQKLPSFGKNGKSVWLKFLKKGLVEDCPFCNPEIMYLYRVNPQYDSVVESNFEMTRKIPQSKLKKSFLKNKGLCKRHKKMEKEFCYDHHNHKYASVKSMSRNGSLYGSLKQEKMDDFVEKFGKSINSKIQFKRGLSKSSLMSFKKAKNYKSPRKPKKQVSYFKLYQQKSERSAKCS